MTDNNLSRRTLAKGAAWTVPAVAVASAAPAMAASTCAYTTSGAGTTTITVKFTAGYECKALVTFTRAGGSNGNLAVLSATPGANVTYSTAAAKSVTATISPTNAGTYTFTTDQPATVTVDCTC